MPMWLWICVCVLGVEHVGGDMFENVPEGDAIFMKVIILIFTRKSRVIKG